jgi:hypothetical protein
MGSGSFLTVHNGSTPEGYDVTSTGTKIADRSDRRRFMRITNMSDVPIFLALRDIAETPGVCPALKNKGIYLAKEGGYFELNNTNMYYGEIWAIHDSTGNKVLCVQPGR